MTSQHPADPGQPAAYWTRLAYESIIRFTRQEQQRRGFTQPQFWILRHLSPEDLCPDGEGRTVEQLEAAMREYLRPEDDLQAESDALIRRGCLARDGDGDRLNITEAGEALRLEIKAATPEIRALIHDGVHDDDYVAALRVLQRLIDNTSAP